MAHGALEEARQNAKRFANQSKRLADVVQSVSCYIRTGVGPVLEGLLAVYYQTGPDPMYLWSYFELLEDIMWINYTLCSHSFVSVVGSRVQNVQTPKSASKESMSLRHLYLRAASFWILLDFTDGFCQNVSSEPIFFGSLACLFTY